MNKGTKPQAIANVRVDVGAGVDRPVPRRLDQSKRPRHQWPVAFPRRLQMVNVYGNLCLLSDSDGLLNRL
jgi:hypothetical protein